LLKEDQAMMSFRAESLINTKSDRLKWKLLLLEFQQSIKTMILTYALS
jgi:hypothetical protein